MIQSLEAEIDPNVTINDHDHNISFPVPVVENFQPSNVLRMKDEHYPISDDHMNFN